MARLALALLGPLHVTLEGQPVTDLGYDKVRALLAYLALETRSHRREALAELFWPDQAAATARASLRVALTTLRRALGDQTAQPPFLLVSRETVQFNPASNYTLDMTTFIDLLQASTQHAHAWDALCASCVAQLTQALALYRGDFLQQVVVRDSVVFEEWVTLNRERLHHQAIEALAKLATYHEERGEDEAARQCAWRTLALEGWHEASHRCLMRVLARSGQRSAALTQYERCRKMLREELGVEPAAETTALYERIRAGCVDRAVGAPRPPTPRPSQHDGVNLRVVAPALPASPTRLPPSNLPIPPTPLIGRAEEVEVLCVRLRHNVVRLLTLTGPPGVGKTRLGIEVAAALQGAFADGICFVTLAPVRNPAQVLGTIAQALRVNEASGQPLVDLLKTYLCNKALLLLLDNFEHVLDCAPLIADLLAACPHLKILVTSRAALHVRAEYQSPVAPLALPNPAHLADARVVAQAPAVALFVARAQAVLPAFTLRNENAAHVAEICRRLDGLPLAIELIAARITTLSPADLLERLDHRLVMLTDGPRDLPAHQQTLREAIAWSYQLLAPDAQALFRRLGVFVGGWTLEAAEAVCAGDGGWGMGDGSVSPSPIPHLPSPTLDGLAALMDKSLLQVVAGPRPEPRWTMLETVREYALERLEASGEGELLRRQHAAYFLALAEAAEPELKRRQQQLWLDRLVQEDGNLRAALTWCQTAPHGAAVGLRLVAALWQFWLLRSYGSEQELWLPTSTVGGLRPMAALWQFWLLRSYGSEQELWLPTILAWLETAGPSVARARVLGQVGQLVYALGDQDRARSLLEESLALADTLDDPPTRMFVLLMLGGIAADQGDDAHGRALIAESVTLARAVGDTWSCARSLRALGRMAYFVGNHAQARAQLTESLTLFQQVGDRWGAASVLRTLADLAMLIEADFEQAKALGEQALALNRELGSVGAIAETLTLLGNVAWYQGEYARGRALLEQSLAGFRDVGYRPRIAGVLHRLGDVAREQGDYVQATVWLEESLALWRELNDTGALVEVLNGLGDVRLSQGDASQAAALYQECLDLCRELEGGEQFTSIVLRNLGRVARAQGDDERAFALFAEGLTIFQDVQNSYGVGCYLAALAGVWGARGQALRAARLLGAAEALRGTSAAPVGAQADYARDCAAVRAQLDTAAFEAAWADGRAMLPEQAIGEALAWSIGRTS